MGEKWTPHTRLHIVKNMVRLGKVRTTMSAYNGAVALGFSSRIEMYDAVLALTPSDFHKSMTADKEPGRWREVYRPVYNGQSIYL